jgi:hypothetical protein
MDDLDRYSSTPSSDLKRASSPPSSTGDPRKILPQAQLTGFNEKMKRQMWTMRVKMALEDDTLWRPLFSDVLFYLVYALVDTDLKPHVITPPTPSEAEEIVAGFDDKEFKEWTYRVQHCVNNNDWTELIVHCMNIFH